MSDLIRSHEGNADFNELDPRKVHWGKFNMMGRFISSTTQCQAQCRSTNDYNFPERPQIRDLLQTSCVMDEEVGISLGSYTSRPILNLLSLRCSHGEYPPKKTRILVTDYLVKTIQIISTKTRPFYAASSSGEHKVDRPRHCSRFAGSVLIIITLFGFICSVHTVKICRPAFHTNMNFKYLAFEFIEFIQQLSCQAQTNHY
jgi:hypothetical protein